MKEARDYYDQFDTCRERDIPLCADACPFRLDILDIQERISAKRFNAAYKSIRNCVCFPGIVAEVCPAYCQKHCIRETIDDPVEIRLLEKSVIALATRHEPNSYNLPKRDVKVAVVGAGLSGMAFALKMASRKYDVSVFEKSDQIGGQLKGLLDEAVYMAEFDLQFKYENYSLTLNDEVNDNERFRDFNVVYIATGSGGNDFAINREGPELPYACEEITWSDDSKTGIFAGGSLMGSDLMHSLADGVNMATVADNYIKTGVLSKPDKLEASKCIANEDRLLKTPRIDIEQAGNTYTEEEAVAEASRCIRCQCDGCESYCDLVDFYKKWPVKMRDEIFLSVKPAGSLVHKSPARKYIAACTECNIMEDTACPEHIDLCGMIKAARHQMQSVDKMPAAYKQYFTRDMEFANGEFAALAKASPSKTRDGANYAFFPGCNLGALNPEYVIKPYRWILDKFPGTSLLLKCCSVPIDWAGNTSTHEKELAALKNDWEKLGRPTLITACLSCDRHMHEFLPEIETITLYELMSRVDTDSLLRDSDFDKTQTFAIFDPCSARGNKPVMDAVRKLALEAGLFAEELPKGDMHGCCGFGGQGAVAQPEFTNHVARKRSELSEKPYLVYCSNCRDIFTEQGKKAIHILDVLFDIDPTASQRLPNVSERRRNRTHLKERLLDEVWGENMNLKPDEHKYKLVMSDEIAAKVESQRILTDDICKVIERSESSGRRTRNPKNGHFKAYDEIGAITLWVEYGVYDGNEREVYNVYSHRMQIKMEAVFNGKKIDE